MNLINKWLLLATTSSNNLFLLPFSSELFHSDDWPTTGGARELMGADELARQI